MDTDRTPCQLSPLARRHEQLQYLRRARSTNIKRQSCVTGTRGFARTCYSRSHSAVSDFSFDPAFPESDIHVASVGVGFVCHSKGKLVGLISCSDDEKNFLAKSAIGLDIYYQGIVFDTRTVTGNLNPTVDGVYETKVHTGGATFRINF